MTTTHTRLLVIALVAQVLIPHAMADEGGEARIIGYGRADAPGVQATVVGFSGAGHRGVKQATPPSSGASHSATGRGLPAPIAISAHNCIPRTDSRGISLTYTFAEGTAADCLSFVSPDPAPQPKRPNARRAPRPSPEQLAESAFDRVLSLAPSPDLEVAPARVGLTGLTSYFWVANELGPISATAGVRGLSVTAEARPVRYLWTFGDGERRQTRHPGRAWTQKRKGNVGHLYETKGRYTAGVEVVWAARWRVNAGEWRALGYFSTTGSAEHPVREVVSVLVRRR